MYDLYMSVCVYVCVSVCMDVFMSVCMYVFPTVGRHANGKRASMHVGIFQRHADSFPIAQAPSALQVAASIPESARPPRLTRAMHAHTV